MRLEILVSDCRKGAPMYYRLKEPYAFRGWKKRPHAIWAEHGEKRFDNPYFFLKDDFLDLLYCNGTEDVDTENLSERAGIFFLSF